MQTVFQLKVKFSGECSTMPFEFDLESSIPVFDELFEIGRKEHAVKNPAKKSVFEGVAYLIGHGTEVAVFSKFMNMDKAPEWPTGLFINETCEISFNAEFHNFVA